MTQTSHEAAKPPRGLAPLHHPSEHTLLRHAAGTLGKGPTLVVSTHLHFCAACRAAVRAYGTLGGHLLCSEAPAPLAEGALAATLARLDAQAPGRSAPAAAAASTANPELPPTLAGQPIAPWRWLVPGIRIAHVGPRERGRSLFLLRCRPGFSLPPHRHSVPEYSCVIKGGYHDAVGSYGLGDSEEADPELYHAPVVDADSECIALIAVEGKLGLEGWLPRLLQPLLGI